MTTTETSRNETNRLVRVLIVGDALALLAFGVIGRMTHNLSASDVSGVLETTVPFMVGWFVVAPWFGLFRSEIALAPMKTTVLTLLAWVPIGYPIGLVLWALVRRRSIPDGIAPEFAIAALAATVVFLLGWRLVYALIRRDR